MLLTTAPTIELFINDYNKCAIPKQISNEVAK